MLFFNQIEKKLLILVFFPLQLNFEKFMFNYKNSAIFVFLGIAIFALSSCGPPGDARKNPPNPDLRVKKNLEEGRGFRLDNLGKKKGGDFMFASANELWRASLDTIDFMPLSSVNYSGGIIVTDWYSDGESLNESVKISIRFLTNEVRTDALDIKVFYKKCAQTINCKVTETSGNIVTELKKKILKKAAIYSEETKKKSKDNKYNAPKDWND